MPITSAHEVTSVRLDPEADAKLERLLSITSPFEPSQIQRFEDDYVIVAIPMTQQLAGELQARAPLTQQLAGELQQARAGDAPPFQEITEVEEQHVVQALFFAKKFEPAIDRTTLELKIDVALDIVQKDETIALVGTVNTSVTTQESKVEVMVNKLAELIEAFFSVATTASWKATIRGVLVSAFTNLAAEDTKVWFLYRESTEHKTTYQYNIVFAIQNKKTGAVMLALPISYKIEVNKKKKELLFFTLQDTATYTVEIKGLRVAQKLMNPRV